MKVLKFGGTSVGSADRIQHVADLVSSRDRNIVVLSACLLYTSDAADE